MSVEKPASERPAAVPTTSLKWDFSRQGRGWRGAEFVAKTDLVPGRLEADDGRLCLGAEQRLILLALLLENVGLDTVVQFGDPGRWREALAARAPGPSPIADPSGILASVAAAAADTSAAEAGAGSSPRRTWNYRVMNFGSGEDAYSAIHEVHYQDDQLRGYTKDTAAVMWETANGIAEGLRVLERMKDALFKPALKEEDFGSSP